jgi:hypothetical protein
VRISSALEFTQGTALTGQALCAETDPEAFFPEKGGSTREAKRVCRSCDLRIPCLEYALANDERFGIWGGMSERDRRRLKAALPGAAARAIAADDAAYDARMEKRRTARLAAEREHRSIMAARIPTPATQPRKVAA